MFQLFQKGGPIMWPLLLASITGMTVVMERILFMIRQKRAETPALRREILSHVEAGDIRRAVLLGENSKDPVVRMLTAGIRKKETLQTTLVSAAAEELRKYSRGVSVLDTIITLAPLLGLLGTVTGMISAFGLLGAGELEAPSAITGGIGEALIATAFGLGIAISSLVPFNWLNTYADGMKHQMERAGSELEALIEKLEKNVSSGEKFYERTANVQTSRAH